MTALFPPGAMRGSVATVTARGVGLARVEQVRVSGEGVTARLGPPCAKEGEAGQSERALTLLVTPDAPPGVRELRFISPAGTSNAAYFCVGAWPEAEEAEPNDHPVQAQFLASLPVTLNGRLEGEADVDCFAFTAAHGETLVLDAASGLFRSPADLQVELLDAEGRWVARRIERGGRDPRLVHRFEQGGRYFVRVRDVQYRSGPAFTYRLTVGRLPVVTRVAPRGGQVGTRLLLRLEGVNLGEMQTIEVSLLPAAEEGRLILTPDTPNGPALPFTLYTGTDPEMTEVEPNDTAATATPIDRLPIVVNGTIDRDGDFDLYRLRLSEPRRLAVELFADRIGARLDAAIRLRDGAGRPIAQNDDAVGVDPRLEQAFVEPGEYQIEVRAADGRGGPDAFYRLRIAEPGGPDFTLTTQPANPNVGRGGAARISVRARRLNGFAGAISVRVEGLPDGVEASPAMIRAGKDLVQFTLSAATDAVLAAGNLHIIGEAEINGRTVRRTATPMESPVSIGARRPEVPAAFHLVTVTDAPPITLRLDPPRVTLKQGEKAKLIARVTRGPGIKEAEGKLNLRFLELPEGVYASVKSIEEGETQTEIELSATEKAAKEAAWLILVAAREGREYVAPAVEVTVE